MENTNSLFIEANLNSTESMALKKIYNNFESIPLTTQQKLENFTNWVRHRDLARFLYKSELMKSIVRIPGSIIECGVLYGGGLSTWIHLSEIHEPLNYGRRIIGIDTFEGFPGLTKEDIPDKPKYPELYTDGTYSSHEQEKFLFELFPQIDKTRKLNQFEKVELYKGDVTEVLPNLLEKDDSLLISCLYLDLDLYQPTRSAIECCLPRMPKGSIICIDEICYKQWPGETKAILDLFDLNNLKIERSPMVPNIGVIRI